MPIPHDDIATGYQSRLQAETLAELDRAARIPPPLPQATGRAGTQTQESGAGQRGLIDQDIARFSAQYGVDPALVHAVIQTESNYQPQAVSRAGAQGLMQLMPGTARGLGVRDPFDPSQNIEGGVRLLRDLARQYPHDLDRQLAAYNAGPGAVQRYDGVPPYPETQNYVRTVKERYRVFIGEPEGVRDFQARPSIPLSPAEQFAQTGGAEVPRQVLGGALAAVQQVSAAVEDVADFTGIIPPRGEATRLSELIPQIATSGQAVPDTVRSFAQFLTVFIPATIALGPAGLPAVASGAVAGAVTDFAAFDPQDPNVSATINQLVPALRNPLTAFLATDPQDSAALNRLRNVAEGVLLGGLADVITKPREAIEAFVQTADALRQFHAALGESGAVGRRGPGFSPFQSRPGPQAPTPRVVKSTEIRTESGQLRVPLRDIPSQELELQDFIRQQGGVNLANETDVPGELRALISRKETGIGGLQNNASGKSLQAMAEQAAEFGFIPTADKVALLEALDRSVKSGQVYSGNFAGQFEVPLTPFEQRLVNRAGQPTLRGAAQLPLEDTELRDLYARAVQLGETFERRIDVQRRAPGGAPRRLSQVQTEANQLIAKGEMSIPVLQRLAPGTVLTDTQSQALTTLMADVATSVRTRAVAVLDAPNDPEKVQAFFRGFVLLQQLDPVRFGAMAEAGRSLRVLGDPNTAANAFVDQYRSLLAQVPDLTETELVARVAALNSVEDVRKYITGIQAPPERQLGRDEPFTRAGDDDVSGGAIPARTRIPRGGHPSIRSVEATTQTAVSWGRWLVNGLSLSGDAFRELWINARLSNPVTHAANVTGNSFMTVWAIPERLVAVPFRGASVGEVRAMSYGVMEGVLDGFRLARDGILERAAMARDETIRTVLRERRSGFERQMEAIGLDGYNTSKLDDAHRAITKEKYAELTGGSPLSGPAQAIDLLGELVRLPGRSLGAADDFFKLVNYRMELRAQAYRVARDDGLSGRALQERVEQLISTPTTELELAAHEAAARFATIQTFQRELGPTGQGINQLRNGMPGGWLLVPFLRTPVNIASEVVQRAGPLAGFSRIFREELAAGGERQARAMAKATLGGIVMGVTAYYASQGRVTGRGPANKGQREALMRQGWRPYSLRVGDEYIAYNRLDPLGLLLGMGADMHDIMAHADEDAGLLPTLGIAMLGAMKDNVLSKSYMQGLADAIEALDPQYATTSEERIDAARRAVERLAGSLIPVGVQQFNREMLDPIQRDADGVISGMLARTPGLSEELPPRRNLYGEPIYVQEALGWDMVSPIYSSTLQPTLEDAEITRLAVDLRRPSRAVRFQGVEDAQDLTLFEYDTYTQLLGGIWGPDAGDQAAAANGNDNLAMAVEVFWEQLPRAYQGISLRQAFRDVVESERYQRESTTDQEREILFRQTLHAYTAAARQALLVAYPGLNEIGGRVESLQRNPPTPQRGNETLRQLGIEAPSDGPLRPGAIPNLGVR